MKRVANESFSGMELFPDDGDLGEGTQQALTDWMLPSTSVDVVHKMERPAQAKPLSIYQVPNSGAPNQEITRAQLQRLMDEDESLPLLLNTRKAVDVIRRFKQQPTEEDAQSPIKALQGKVFEKIDHLEKVKLDGDVPDVPEIKEITEAMSGAITDVRNKSRIQIASIVEATAMLFEHLVELTQGIEAVRQNHVAVMDLIRQNSGGSLLGSESGMSG